MTEQQKPIKEQTNAEKIKELYGTKENLLTTILNMFKQLQKENKIKAEEKGNDNILQLINKITHQKIDMVMPLLDFCFIYFVHHFDDNHPSFKLPTTSAKLHLMTHRINKKMVFGTPSNVAITIFNYIINDEDFKYITQEPPAYITGNKNEVELEEMLNLHINPVIKNLIDELLRLK